MDEIKYRDMVRQLKKKGHLIVEQMTPEKADLLHMAVGVAGEGGELLDQVVRSVAPVCVSAWEATHQDA